MRDIVKIAAIQMEPKIMQNKQNLDNIVLKIKKAADANADLVVLPECSLTGYMFASLEEAMPYMEIIPGPSTGVLMTISRELGIYIIVGLLEIDNSQYFNTAILIGPEGLIGKYRKTHLPYLGVDRFLNPGDQPLRVYKTAIGNIGIHICYDCNFPECARVMTLLGADILALPTNWPEGREKVSNYVVICRAYENKVNLVAVNRVGEERSARFIGLSKIVDSCGDVIAEANNLDEQIIYGDVSLAEAREKRIVFKAGEFEINFIHDRRPELYKEITKTGRK
ncbi:MAG: carbon-nitrogen hydrolase family protein [Dehalococcoidales bacterium]|nr:carbon-nitrogen hydrolase family protein [Dehalococcoidales bacterium]